jgi:predicted MFS family arabinose efflux permease
VLAPKIIDRIGLYGFLVLFGLVEFASILGLAVSTSAIIVGLSFIIHHAALPLVMYALDIFLEALTQKENETGELRSVYLTLGNVALIISPTIVGLMLAAFSFSYIYILSAIVLIPSFLFAHSRLTHVRADTPDHKDTLSSLAFVWKTKDIRWSILANFILQFFYAWMVIYTPLYLIQVIGFSWENLGALFTIMLLPFVLFEIPVGWLADKKTGEKELMVAGFIITAISTAMLAVPTLPTFALWAGLLFMSRLGASTAEITTESYFFKQVKDRDVSLIGIFRMTKPLAYIAAPIVATLALPILELRMNFVLLSVITLAGAVFAFKIHDTK